jgi:hypothetical protein
MTDFPALLDEHEFGWLLESGDLDELRELHDTLSNKLAKVEKRIFDLENGSDDWTAYRDCVTGERRILQGRKS